MAGQCFGSPSWNRTKTKSLEDSYDIHFTNGPLYGALEGTRTPMYPLAFSCFEDRRHTSALLNCFILYRRYENAVTCRSSHRKSYPASCCTCYARTAQIKQLFGIQGWDRTTDRLLNRQMLLPTELLGYNLVGTVGFEPTQFSF